MSHATSRKGTRPAAEGQRDGVTVRAVLVAFILLVLVSVGAFYIELAWRKVYAFSSGVPAMAPVVLLFLLAAAAGTPLFRRIAFTRAELLTIYTILLVGGRC